MRGWGPARIAELSGSQLVSSPAEAGSTPADAGPERATIDSRDATHGALFFGLPGERVDGGVFARDALTGGAWGVVVAPEHATEAAEAGRGVVLSADDPLLALQRLAAAWRLELGARVIAITGSTGKTTTKDMVGALLAPSRRTVASRENFNTEIGTPLEILAAPAGTEVLVLEHAMRGRGQIAELAEISDPDVGVIVNIGPVHLELLGSIEAIAATKAELIEGLRPGATAVIPAGEPLLAPYMRPDLELITFGERGDVRLLEADGDRVAIDANGTRVELEVQLTQAHLRTNLLAAVAAAHAIGVTPRGRVEIALSASRGQRVTLPGGVTLIDDCYNANPMSMRAALDDLGETATGAAGGRRIAVLGDMLELGPDEREFHAEIGGHAASAGVDVLVTVGPLAAAMADRFEDETYAVADAGEAAALVGELLQDGDVVLVKASRGVGLELVTESLIESER